jgi:hypothetical protein
MASRAAIGSIGRSYDQGRHAANLAFIALSLHQLGQIDESRIALDRLRSFMQDPPADRPSHYGESDWSRAVTAPTFLGEAEALVGESTGPDEDRD